MTPFLRQTFVLLVALAALAIVLLMVARADAKELKLAETAAPADAKSIVAPKAPRDGTREIVVEANAQNETAPTSESAKGAASTDLTEESGDTLVGALAEEPEDQPLEPGVQAEAEQNTITDRETLARAYLYALYLRAAQRGHSSYGYSHSFSSGRSYDHCDD